MKWSDRIRDFVGFVVAGYAYHWWLHRQERKHSTAKNSEAAMKKTGRGKAALERSIAGEGDGAGTSARQQKQLTSTQRA